MNLSFNLPLVSVLGLAPVEAGTMGLSQDAAAVPGNVGDAGSSNSGDYRPVAP